MSKQLNIEVKIKSKFQLFAGGRSVEEDTRIFEKVLSLVFDEIIAFLHGNLSKKDKESLIKELEKSSKVEEKIKSVLKFANKIKNYTFKLEKQIDYFLNTLLYKTVENKN